MLRIDVVVGLRDRDVHREPASAGVRARDPVHVGGAIPGVASACTATMLTRGTVLLLVTDWSVNPAAALPVGVLDHQAPVPGFV